MPPLREAELPAANRIFVDREELQRIFEKAAFNIPSDRAILRVFYGAGGQGKTALCRELMRRTAASVEPSFSFLRRAVLDLHGRQKVDPDLLLVSIRNAFAEANVGFPCFDLALKAMWEAQRGEQPFPSLTKPWFGRSIALANRATEEGSSELVDWLHSDKAQEFLGEAVAEIPGFGFVLKRLGELFIDKTKRAYLKHTRKHLQRLHRNGELLPSFEISKLLPWMLAQDLNYHLEHNKGDRFILFIDEYERVFDGGGTGADWKENPFDRHMRSFIQETNGLLAVFFSRERLRWENHPDWRGDLRDHQHIVGGLADEDADDFLEAIPIEDALVREAIINGARERSDTAAPVYPLMLDLQVEHWRNLMAAGQVKPECFTVQADSFESRRIEIIERLLRDYSVGLEATILRLSVAQRFDRDAFRHIVATFHTAVPLDTFDRIAALSFVTQSEDGFLTLHNVVRAVLREQLGEQKRRTSIEALQTHFSQRARTASHFELTAEKIAALTEAAYLRRAQGINGYVAWLVEATEPLRVGAYYGSAMSLWREALDFVEQVLGPDDPSTANCLNNLAYLLKAQGDYAGAKPLFERALAICETVLGPDDPATATGLNNLADLLRTQGDYAAAKPLFVRALAIYERSLGSDHSSTVASLNNLASLLRAQADYAGAKLLYERALAICERARGADHTLTAASLNNLASLLRAQGDYEGAKPLVERALAIREKALGTNHPSTAAALSNLAGLLQAQRDYGRAKPLYERALDICKKSLGEHHPSTATTLHNLACLLQAQEHYEEAKLHFERALAIREAALGDDHPSTAASLHCLADVLRAQSDYQRAKPLYERALAIRENALGVEHPTAKILRQKLRYVAHLIDR
jgi:tetratricopeptide (TPR) repeat protein